MGFFDEGGTFGDAFSDIFGSPANAAPGPGGPSPDMPLPQDPGGGLAGAAGSNAGPPVDQVTGVPPASQTLNGAASPAPQVGGFPASQGMDQPQSGTPGIPMPQDRPDSAPPRIPTSTGPTPIASSTSTGPPGPLGASSAAGPAGTMVPYTGPWSGRDGGGGQPPAAGRGLLDDVMGTIGKDPNTPFGGGLFGDPRTARQFAGSLGAGLSAAGNSAGKSPAQAAFGGAGAAIQGGEKADDTGTEQQRRATASERENQRLGETKRRNDQMFQVYQDRMKKAQMVGTVQSRAQAWENSDLGKLQKANTEILKHQSEIRKSYADDLRVQAGSPAAADIRKQMQKEMDDKKAEVYGQYGIDPKNINKLQSRGTTIDNPHPKPNSWDEFHAIVKPGQFFINPKDGKVMQRNSPVPAPVDQGGTMQADPSFMQPPATAPDYGGGYQMAG